MDQQKDAIIYNKYKPIMRVLMSSSNQLDCVTQIIKQNEHLLPVRLINMLERTPVDYDNPGVEFTQAVNEWLISRRIPEQRDDHGRKRSGRENLAEARRFYPNFDHPRTHQFSLSDQYWIGSAKGGGEGWDKWNFFHRNYSTIYSDLFFATYDVKPQERAQKDLETPDLTANGVLMKAWVREEDTGKSYLIKAGSEKYHQEPMSEVMASRALKAFGILPFVEYNLKIYKTNLCSICENFVTEDTEFVPADDIYKKQKRPNDKSRYQHLIDMCKQYVPKDVYAEYYIPLMIGFDRLTGNKDRNLGNFGFLRNVNTGEITQFAPLFDNGRCFFPANANAKGIWEDDTTKDEGQKHRDEIGCLQYFINILCKKGMGLDYNFRDDIPFVESYHKLDDGDRKNIVDQLEESQMTLTTLVQEQLRAMQQEKGDRQARRDEEER